MALEKQDAEALALLRSGHEIALLKLVRDTRLKQIDESSANIDALQKSADTVLQRFGHYQKLLGTPAVTKDQNGLPAVEQSSSLAVATDASGIGSGLGLIRKEVDQFTWSANANVYTQLANTGHLLAGIISLIPDSWTGDALVAGATFGGSFLSGAAGAIAKAIEMLAADANYHASQLGALGGYERRQDEWVYQSKLALSEFVQIQQQIVAAQIRKDIAESELTNHDTQIANAQEVDEFMRNKFTSQQLYGWMSSQVAQVYFDAYQLALDQAQRAERAYQHELAADVQGSPFIQAGNWDNLKRGLLAGEHLHQDLKRMECAYLEANVREFEITKHVSLLQLDPGALISLKQTYTCTLDVPEALFDLDCPGHYMRRLKMVSLSIPCVVGPYTSVNANLQLTKSMIRVKSTGDQYSLKEAAAAVVMTIVTSSAQQDSGMFEPVIRDERYLPFEGAGAVSTWTLTLPDKFRPFDYETISDVVLHIRYTARDGGDSLKTSARAGLQDALNALKSQGSAANGVGLARLLSLRHEFPMEWSRLTSGADAAAPRSEEFAITKNRFPFLFWNTETTLKISQVDLYSLPKPDKTITDFPSLDIYLPKQDTSVSVISSPSVGNLKGVTFDAAVNVDPKEENAKWKIAIANIAAFRTDVADLIMVCHYKVLVE
jgi:hypothetical protein